MKTILFDLDGTLLDTLTDLTESVNYTLGKLGLPPRKKEEVRLLVGNGIRNLMHLILETENEEEIQKALNIYSAYYTKHENDNTKPYDGITDLIHNFSLQGRKMAVVSNKPDPSVLNLVKLHFPEVEYAIGQKEELKRKPWPDMLFAIMEDLEVEKKDCLYVGDSEVDIFTAQNAGIPCISVTWGFRDESLLVESGGTIFAHTAEELYEKISELDEKN